MQCASAGEHSHPRDPVEAWPQAAGWAKNKRERGNEDPGRARGWAAENKGWSLTLENTGC